MTSLLELEDVRAGYGSHAVLHGVSLDVREGEFAALVGLNGAGKTVTLRTISGILRPWSGSVRLDGREITRLDPEDRVAAGIAHVPQGRAVFPYLTVEENLRLGAATQRSTARRAEARDRVFSIFPILADRRKQAAGTLSGGEQEMLAVGRALMASPRLVLVDEPSQGLAPLAVEHLFEILSEVNRNGVTMLMVEQNTTFTLRIAHRVFVMQKGEIVLASPVAELTDTTELLGYLGVGALTKSRIESVVAARRGDGSASAEGAGATEKPRRARTPRTPVKTAARKTAARKTAARKAAARKPAKPTAARDRSGARRSG